MLNIGFIIYVYMGESTRADKRARERKKKKDHAVGIRALIVGMFPLSVCCH